jgi:hypothetical protein
MYSIPSPSLAEHNPEGYNNALRMMPRGYGCGSCNFCGMPLVHNCLVNSSDGKKFAVGCDCINKVGDAGLVKDVGEAKRKAAKEAREAARIARYNARIAKEKAANGGKSNAELREAKWAAENKRREKVAKSIAKLLWPTVAAVSATASPPT